MKQGVIIGIVIVALIVFGIIILCTESARWDSFKSAFGFSPSGTNCGFWAGDPNPKLKDHEQNLIGKIWDEEYKKLQEAYKEMVNANSEEYGRLRNSFLRKIENFKNEIGLTHHFGYWIVPDDPDGLLKEK